MWTRAYDEQSGRGKSRVELTTVQAGSKLRARTKAVAVTNADDAASRFGYAPDHGRLLLKAVRGRAAPHSLDSLLPTTFFSVSSSATHCFRDDCIAVRDSRAVVYDRHSTFFQSSSEGTASEIVPRRIGRADSRIREQQLTDITKKPIPVRDGRAHARRLPELRPTGSLFRGGRWQSLPL